MKKPPRPARSKQPEPASDPMPLRIDPAQAALKQEPPAGGHLWSWEIKWDGYRLHVHVEPGRVRVLTRNGHDWTVSFPAIAEAARSLCRTMILDGEAVVLDDEGRSDFGLLERSLGVVSGRRRLGNQASPAIMMTFDLLYLDGRDLRGLEYAERRQLLQDILQGRKGAIQLSEEFDVDPAQLLERACQMQLEGIVGKRRDRRYRSGRTGDWVKLKCVQSAAFVIVGYEPSATGSFASLQLAAYKGDDLVYVGSVGTGFKTKEAAILRGGMDKRLWRRKQPPVPYDGKRKVIWLQPTLIAEIEYRAWTTDHKLRHCSYKGLRKGQDNADVYRMVTAPHGTFDAKDF